MKFFIMIVVVFISKVSHADDDLTGKNLICKNLKLNEIILIEFLKESDDEIQKWIDAHIQSQKKSFENSIFSYDKNKIFKPNLDSIPELIPNYVYLFRGKINAKDYHESEIVEYRFNYRTDLETITIFYDASQLTLKSRWGDVKDYSSGSFFIINRQELTLVEYNKPDKPYECELVKKYEIKDLKEELIVRFQLEQYSKNKETEEIENELKNNQKI